METQIIRLIGVAFNKDLSGFEIADCTPEKIEGWDSLGFLNLIMLLEEEFKVSFGLEDIAEMSVGGEELQKIIKKAAG